MKHFLSLVALLFALTSQSQHTISGTFSPAEDYTWLIAYHLKPGTQQYIADTAIKDGKFEMNIPENSPMGTYRLVYAVPQAEYNFDILYTGKEDLELSFDAQEGLEFIGSNENILFSTYFKEIQEAESRLISFYTNGSTDKKEFNKIAENYMAVQNSFMEKSSNLMVQDFVTANKPYIPSKYESIQQYVKNRKEHYFDELDLNNPVLQASSFLTDKVGNYVFTALPLDEMTPEETEIAMKENFKTVVAKLDGVSDKYQFSILYSIWAQASASNFHSLADYIFLDYLTSKAKSPENQKIVADIALQNRIRIGAIASEITWEKGEEHKTLSGLEGSENYVLVFWSSTCGHCLRELPALHEKLKEHPNVKVVAVGLEDNDVIWKLESAKLENFEHAIALGKWDSDYAALYGIDSTPTYFILDKDKRIIAKPENDKGVVEFLEGK